MGNPLKDTVSRLSHSITIRANGVTIGAISELKEQHSQGLKALYGLGTFEQPGRYSARSGEPYEIVPNNVEPITLDIQRYDLVATKLEQAFNTAFDLTVLSNQVSGIEVFQIERKTDGTIEGFVYRGCWFESLGRTLSAEGERVIQANATLKAVTKQRV